MHPILLVILYVAIVLVPLTIAQLFNFSPRSIQDELATGLGLTALAILLIEFVLSGRFRTISGRVGMDVTMRFHQLLARTAAALLLVHPFLYQTGITFPAPWDVTRELTLGLDIWSMFSGLLAWIFTFVLVLFAVFRDKIGYTYETWRQWHGIGALVIIILSLHHAIAAGRYSSQNTLIWFWGALFTTSLLSLAWVYFVRPYRQLRAPYSVKSVNRIALKTWELVIAPSGQHRFDFQAGQFVWLNIGNSPFQLYENPFSISTAPAQGPEIGFVIKELGDFTNSIGDVKVGCVAYIDGPHGNLTLVGREGRGIALIAGGVGIAPLIGILRQLAADRDPRPILLIYGNRTREQIAYAQELEELTGILNLKVELVLSEPPLEWSGRMGITDAGLITGMFSFDGAPEWLYLLCGPPDMVESVEAVLVECGVPLSQVISERFNYD